MKHPLQGWELEPVEGHKLKALRLTTASESGSLIYFTSKLELHHDSRISRAAVMPRVAHRNPMLPRFHHVGGPRVVNQSWCRKSLSSSSDSPVGHRLGIGILLLELIDEQLITVVFGEFNEVVFVRPPHQLTQFYQSGLCAEHQPAGLAERFRICPQRARHLWRRGLQLIGRAVFLRYGYHPEPLLSHSRAPTCRVAFRVLQHPEQCQLRKPGQQFPLVGVRPDSECERWANPAVRVEVPILIESIGKPVVQVPA